MVGALFTTAIYQPFFNIILVFYWLLSFVMPEPDMGIAVILLTVLIRILLLPLSISSSRTEKERREIAAKIKEVEELFADDPIRLRKESKKVLHGNRRIVISEVVNLFIQVAIALMLWRMFSTGLTGEDVHLIYDFMPTIPQPYNLNFLHLFTLYEPHWQLNLIQSLLIFVLETVSLLTSPFATDRAEVVRLQLTLPVVSFLVFMFLPAGKKLFVITTLAFSIILTIAKFIWRKVQDYQAKAAAPEPEVSTEQT